jgi:hypothetical protein
MWSRVLAAIQAGGGAFSVLTSCNPAVSSLLTHLALREVKISAQNVIRDKVVGACALYVSRTFMSPTAGQVKCWGHELCSLYVAVL